MPSSISHPEIFLDQAPNWHNDYEIEVVGHMVLSREAYSMKCVED